MAAHNELGKWGEEIAAAFVEKKGYEILQRDWKYGHHDLDIIAKDEDTLVIIEVKTRRNRLFGNPEEAIDYKKTKSSVCHKPLRKVASHQCTRSFRHNKHCGNDWFDTRD